MNDQPDRILRCAQGLILQERGGVHYEPEWVFTLIQNQRSPSNQNGCSR